MKKAVIPDVLPHCPSAQCPMPGEQWQVDRDEEDVMGMSDKMKQSKLFHDRAERRYSVPEKSVMNQGLYIYKEATLMCF